MKSYILKPKSVKITQIKEKEFSLSSFSFNSINYKNKNIKLLSQICIENKKWFEPWSSEYIEFSENYFIRISEMSDLNFTFGINNDTKKIKPVNWKNIINKWNLCYQTASNVWNVCFYNWPKAYYNSHIRKLNFENNFYIFSLLKSNFCKEQVSISWSIKWVDNFRSELLENIKIPFPSKNNHENPENIEKWVSLITQNIINKEEQIKLKNEKIDELIEKELLENQKVNNYSYSFPRISEIKIETRLDTGLYEKEYKYLKSLIENYKYSKILTLEEDLGFNISRWQNLQISNIWNSYYSDEEKKNFYKLIVSKNFTNYWGISNFNYIWNKQNLKQIKKWDIIFSCRWDLWRLIIFIDEIKNTITNIDNVHISNNNIENYSKIFIWLWLKFLKEKWLIDKVAITGSWANSFTQYQFKQLPILFFPEQKQQEISIQYYNKIDKNIDLNLKNYLQKEFERNSELWIFQLNMELFELKEKLENIVDKIVMDEKIDIIV